MVDDIFHLLIPPLVVGGIAGMTLSIQGINKIQQLAQEKYDAEHKTSYHQLSTLKNTTNQNGIDPNSDNNIHENPVLEELKKADGKLAIEKYHYTIFLVLCFVISEMLAFLCILSLIIFSETSSFFLIFSYFVFFVAICLTAYIYVVMSPPDLGMIKSVDLTYVDKILRNNLPSNQAQTNTPPENTK